MRNLKSSLKTGAFAAALAVGGLAVTIPVASADVACNSRGECWHVHERYAGYPAHLGIQFYGDDWRRSHEHDRHFRWMRDRDDDRGYYSRGEWHAFSR